MNSTANAVDPKDPGAKKTDGYSKQVVAEKIVNEQDQEKINNSQASPATTETEEEAPAPAVVEKINAELSEKLTEEPDHVTEETLEDDRKQQAGINP